MCGIAAILSLNESFRPTRDILQQMTDSIAHRGPDAEGAQILDRSDVHVALGHRRLSIIDLEGGQQPMSDADRRNWITYNGEVYNHTALRSELEALGCRYRTKSDTETVLYAYQQWGTACLDRLRGMFAFAIWDDRSNCLFAARDRLGIKPFYYAHLPDGTLVCASEIKAILASRYVQPEINLAAVPEYMTFGFSAGPATLFSGINKLMPGHWLRWSAGKLEIQPWWDVPQPPTANDNRSEVDYVAEFSERFDESVRLRLMSDVPLGVFLSGGLDSSAIAATMAKHVKEPIKTFSVGFSDPRYNEFNFAREVATSIAAEHHEVTLTPDDFFGSLPKLIWHEDEPIRFSSSVALYHVSQLAREHVKVVLTGEGSDELFAGYDRYWATLFNQKWGRLYQRALPSFVRDRMIRDTLWRWPLPLNVRKKLSHTFLSHSMSPDEMVFDNFYSIFPGHDHESLLEPAVLEAAAKSGPYVQHVAFYDRRSASHPLDRLLYTDQKTYLVELLMKQDQMSMAASIESRVPFLDHRLVEFAAQLPARMKLRGTDGKYVVKQAMRRLLPDSIVTRQKMGFPVPINDWLRLGFRSMAEKVLLSDRTASRGIFRPSYVKQIIEQHRLGQRDHAERLWTLINFELWARVFIDQEQHDDVRLQTLNQSNGLVKNQELLPAIASPSDSTP